MESIHISNNMRQLKFGELFCGAGGLAYELRQGSTNIKATRPQWSGGSF